MVKSRVQAIRVRENKCGGEGSTTRLTGKSRCLAGTRLLCEAHLALHHALAVSSDAAAGVAGARRLPGALASGAVVVKVPAAQVPVGLPVAQNMERRSAGDGGYAGLGDLQLLEVGVDRRVRPARTNG